MSRSLTAAFKAAAFAPETSEAFLMLVTISHDDLASDICLSSDAVDTTSNGVTYSGGFPFSVTIPDDRDDGPPQAQLSIDNIDRAITEAIRSVATRVSVTLAVVLASDPDTVEAEFDGFELTNITYDKLKVTGTLALAEFDEDAWPAKIYNPQEFPGMPW